MPAVLARAEDGTEVGRGVTDTDGRVAALNDAPLPGGDYVLTLDVEAHTAARGGPVLYPRLVLHVRLAADRAHYHLPVLAGPFSVTTYLGS